MFRQVSLLLLVTMVAVVMAACGGSGKSFTADQAVQAFKDAGLEIEGVRDITDEDVGTLVPKKHDSGKRFELPSLGNEIGGRIFVYKKDSDLLEMKKFYDDLGENAPMLFSYTLKKGNILVHLPGKLTEEQYEQYKSALEKLK
ncbi:stress protein [Paenibacillaceae bacterium]|nr:stress protein [Paenibacillaceae bacterium]